MMLKLTLNLQIFIFYGKSSVIIQRHQTASFRIKKNNPFLDSDVFQKIWLNRDNFIFMKKLPCDAIQPNSANKIMVFNAQY